MIFLYFVYNLEYVVICLLARKATKQKEAKSSKIRICLMCTVLIDCKNYTAQTISLLPQARLNS